MFSLIVLGLINTVILLSPPKLAVILLELMVLPRSPRVTLLVGVVVNVVVSVAFERWGVQYLAQIVGSLMKMYQEHRRVRLGKAYKLVDGR
jgi:cation-transporting ATPase 13A3/4/5